MEIGVGVRSVRPDNPKSFSWFLSRAREDYVANRRQWSRAGFHAIVVYRLGVWAHHQTGLVEKIASFVYVLLYAFVRNFYSIEISRVATIGRRLWVPYAAGIVISPMAEVGDDCLIHQNVTIGVGKAKPRGTKPYAPKLGNDVELGAGAVIIGGVTIGDGARIGPNAVVMTDIPPGGTAFASPAKTMKLPRKATARDADTPATETGDR